MAHAWIEDKWLKKSATTAEKRSLNSARDPQKAKVSPAHRKTAYGQGQRWIVYWNERLPGGATKRRNRSFTSKDQAEAWRTQVDDDIRSDRYIDKASSSHSFAEAAEIWLSTRSTVSPGTERTQRRIYEQRLKPQWGETAVGDITSLRIEVWASALLNGTAPGGGSLKPDTIQNLRNVLNQIMDIAVRCRWIHENPGRQAKWPRLRASESRRLVFLTIPQVQALADACDRIAASSQPPSSIAGDGTFILFLALTGLRIGEAAALRIGDINQTTWTVSVTKTRSIGQDGRIWSAEGPTKNGVDREIPISPLLRDRLEALMQGHDDHDFLFRKADGGMLDYGQWRRVRWIPAVRMAGLGNIRRLTPHALRHTFASMLIAQGTDVKTVQRLMGHLRASMTLDTYSALWPGNEKTAIAGINAMWEQS